MVLYFVQRVGLALLIVVLAMTILFGLVYVIPGDPAAIALGPRATPEMRELLRQDMGLDQPLYVQLGRFLSDVVTGNLGRDVWSKRPVSDIVLEALPYTLALAASGLGWAALLGIPLGCFAAVRRNTMIDRVVGVVSVGAITMPSFIVAIYSLLIFCIALGWFPAIGVGEQGNIFDQLHHLVLPAFAVGLGWVGYLARLVRASMLEVMGENHIRTARAFGLPEHIVVLRYALRLAILPVITLLGLAVGGLLSSAVFAEVVFNRPGIGLLIYNAATTRNYPVVKGTMVITIMLFTSFTLMADLLIAWLDPRVRSSI